MRVSGIWVSYSVLLDLSHEHFFFFVTTQKPFHIPCFFFAGLSWVPKVTY